MKYIFVAEMLVCSAIAIVAADHGKHLISFASAALMLFCLWMVDKYRRDS
jgi:hypothetical protein